ncbi:MAG TPA: type I glyceraldehyde-3-phosphate dehydrogenase [Pseudomonas sp.]|jgi:glyceraldehyde 3-phosphate dehydrogenase|uniref:ArsJ-associated glyceraldehyde-3-phosphate dehydrogenase n=1 Tax=Stutzerimonas xanthomarina TaxID=271420 RepID=UPI000E8F3804|nr:ArsJ-associated glyceraldehyde-3-phosphate dehydrogenase [Stutzerimonas xanthomarina]MBU0812573.1 ArsJ-associated glyceraldehyde-3-phosphate dehydrogenase [Gammaproteobacteria bacterium]HAQ87574.1 type I glyceraldehyde-3-phosphate dehydrogenase [Pseudomonas sp.]MBK3848968.1 ArsJ-associated glyceraldehyde-3-phosphate dehydrogenase [Stutzerimonas xanthomarina]MBU0853842.1 ArsJ-associated glyceraldehyde-3-phosphate dehydrogenase [Gammaproteobacteria bacterium]MBU1300810.1 ArsJ-associated glyce|tara:strand:- start:5257 stop:6264 length:1008 start_codon:yes stop_codon:yes gene_type:complete
MTLKIGINGFGRIGRLALRAAWDWPELEFIQINDPAGDAATHAHLLNFDSVHGRWQHEASSDGNCIVVDGKRIRVTANKAIADTDWSGCDLVIEASGKMKTVAVLQGYLDQGVKRVVVSAPVKEAGALNIVMGVNDTLFDPALHRIVTAASCTTNCLAPVVKVIHEHLGIRHGSITTIHDLTNTQSILDQPHKDLRRARASGMSLIPTTTGSATAIAEIFPELRGKLNGHAVRVPLANASLTDCVFEVERATSVEEVNTLLQAAASEGPLKGILGYEARPLVSIDYRTDPRSSIIDALSTMVVNGTQVKLYAWYDNEWGYANRTVELARKVGLAD